ncbi:SGNH/GDSL hydrolase family protein [Planotetraspora sp. GP83]|uniref:SGNH/GDSL hydrolase family protein n=1 Tax=Planotetraspora sp. GP83 TaxID=3156264 RepID=UPI0035113135
MSRHTRPRPVRRATATATAVLSACAVLATAGQGTAAAAGAGVNGARYVALGDSYASGYGIAPLGNAACDRSEASSYPISLRSLAKSQSFTNVTCSAATTRGIRSAENGQPPQIQALKPDTTLVTLTIGGNDIGFRDIVTTCVTLAFQQPTGDPCRDHFQKNGTDQILTRIQALKPRIASVVTDIRRKSPKATVALVGYPSLLPDSGKGCRSPQVPFADGDFSYLRNITVRLNRALAEQARKASAVYVDTYTPTIGYDMCQDRTRRVIEPLFTAKGPSGDLAPMSAHPNVRGNFGMAWYTKQALDKLDG